MALVDERGRLFGRVNLVDLAIGVFVLLLVPLAYGAFVLFRTPDPTIDAIEPTTLEQGTNLRIRLTGTGFRPFLNTTVGALRSQEMLVASPTVAEVTLPELGPGTYDLILADQSREVARKPNAITIVGPRPLPPIVVQVSGTFTSVPEQVARTFVAGATFPAGSADPEVEIVAVKPVSPVAVRMPTALGVLERRIPGMVRVPAVLRLHCTPDGEQCKVGNVRVEAGATIPAAVDTDRSFRIFDVSAADTPPFFDAASLGKTIEVDVRAVTSPETMALLRSGAADTDRRLLAASPPASPAVLLSFKRLREVDATSSVDWQGPDIKAAPQILDVPRQLTLLEATLRLPVERTPDGWQYKGSAVKLGAPFGFEGPFYTLRGWILRVRVPPAGAGPARSIKH